MKYLRGGKKKPALKLGQVGKNISDNYAPVSQNNHVVWSCLVVTSILTSPYFVKD